MNQATIVEELGGFFRVNVLARITEEPVKISIHFRQSHGRSAEIEFGCAANLFRLFTTKCNSRLMLIIYFKQIDFPNVVHYIFRFLSFSTRFQSFAYQEVCFKQITANKFVHNFRHSLYITLPRSQNHLIGSTVTGYEVVDTSSVMLNDN